MAVTAFRCLVAFAALVLIKAAAIDKKEDSLKWSGDYVILLPKALRPSVQHSISAQIQSNNVGFRIDSTDPDTKKTVQGKASIFPDGNGIVKYRIPFANFVGKKMQLSCIAFACAGNVKTCARGGQLFAQNVTLPVLKDDVMIFTETSKPIYKPGETVKFRILPLMPNSLKPSQDEDDKKKGLMFDLIYLEAPNKMRMAQWNNVSWLQALKGLNFELSADPLYGTWKVVSQMGSVKDKESFKVKEYVLPKFTISLKPPPYIYIEDSIVKFSVCAKYTTGRPMKAVVKAEFCVKPKRVYSRRRNAKRPCLRVKKVLDGSKECVEFKESTEPLQLWNATYPYWDARGFLNATVVENGTNMSVNKTEFGGRLERSPFKLIGKVPDTYRPGLPFYGQLLVANHDGSPRPNVDCNVQTSWGYRWSFSKTYTSDKNGLISFGIPPLPAESNSVSLYFSVPTGNQMKKKPSPRGRMEIRLRNPRLYETISRYHSPSNTNLQVYPLYRSAPQAPCSSGKLIVRLQSNVPLFDKVIHVISSSRGNLRTTKSFGTTTAPEQKCEDQDNAELGHFKCVPQKDGKIKIRCLPGWKGDNCLTPICEKGCVKGVCRKPGECACRKGWEGHACYRCVRRNGCMNGYCHYGNDCQCEPGYYGYNCRRKGRNRWSSRSRPPPIDEVAIPSVLKYDPSSQLEDLRLFTRQLEIPIAPELYPSSQIVIWFIHQDKNGTQEFVVARVKLDNLQDCLDKATPTSFSFDKKTVRPGEKFTATIKATGKAPKCALAVSDIALDTFGTRGGISQSSLVQEIEGAMKEIQEWHYLDPYNVLQNEHCRRQRKKGRSRRMVMPYRPQNKDSSTFFKEAGVFVLSNIGIMTAPCRSYYLRKMARQGIMEDSMPVPLSAPRGAPRPVLASAGEKSPASKAKAKVKARVRTFFPETWKFELLEDPKAKLNLKAPDSMTTWKSTMYCVSSQGLGLSPPDKLVVFQPFFLQMALPYSLIRGESARIPVKVFSYRKECSEITLTMKPSPQLKSNGPQIARSCVCNFDQITAYFRVQPNVLGKVPIEVEAVSRPSRRCPNPKSAKPVPVVADAVRRQLLIEPEGIPEEISTGDLLCPAGKSSSVHLTINAPKKTGLSIVEDSERAYFMWSANVIGSSMENLDSMVRMPYGCGEQNMMSMVPSIYVLDYFTKAGIKKAQVMDKARKFIRIGYQRQLKYRHDDGSYSAFGKRDKVGSTWLTAFVFKSFVAAGQYVTIDSKILTSALKFLMSKTQSNGCFREDGRVFSSTLKGGQRKSTDEVSITAYILSALIEANTFDKTLRNATAPGISAAVRCLNSTTPRNATAMKNLSSFAVAMRTYALMRWNATHNLTKRYRDELQRRQINKDGFIYWKADEKEPPRLYCRPWTYFVSADVETTAYALLSKLTVMGRGGRELVKVLPTLRWLTSQRNERGGWYSTQDTIIALQALSTFAARTSFSGKGIDLSVTIKTNDETRKVKMNNDNKLVLSKMALKVPNSLSITARGEGCLVAQASVLFNVKDVGRQGAPFALSASATQRADKCDEARVRVCVRYNGASKQSNMAVIKARMASGWQTTKDSIEKLNKNVAEGGLKLIEVDPDKALLLYFDYFTSTESCLAFTVTREIEVADVKPMIIQVYDYYKPHETQEQNVQLLTKACNKSSQNDGSQAKCPVCTGVNDTAVTAIERICAKQHYFSAAEREATEDQKWTITQFIDDMVLGWNGALKMPKSCSCALSNRVIVGVHTRWWAVRMDEDVQLDKDWTVINVDSLSSEGHKKLKESCVTKSESFNFHYQTFMMKLEGVMEEKEKKVVEPPQPAADDSLPPGVVIEPPESMCFSCSEHINPDLRFELSEAIAKKTLTIVRVKETKRDNGVLWKLNDLKGKTIGTRTVSYRKDCLSQCKYQGTPSKDRDLLVISKLRWKLQFDNENTAIVPDGSFYIDEYSTLASLFPQWKEKIEKADDKMFV